MGLALITRFNLSAINGFVLPKFTQASITTWWEIMKETHLCMMPTLETEDVFDVAKMVLSPENWKIIPLVNALLRCALVVMT